MAGACERRLFEHAVAQRDDGERRVGTRAPSEASRLRVGEAVFRLPDRRVYFCLRQSMARLSPPVGTEYMGQPIRSDVNSRTVVLP